MKKQIKDFIVSMIFLGMFLSLTLGISLCLEDLDKQFQNQTYTETTEFIIEETNPPAFITEMPSETVNELINAPILIPTTEDWFDDALFIGDSRTVQMKVEKRLGKADYFCRYSMSVFTAQGWTASDTRFSEASLKDVLTMYDYGKVFIELGINECGYDSKDIIESYQDLIDLIYEFEPQALIVIQSVITVSEYKASDEKFSLARIENLNKELKLLATRNNAFYINPNEFAADENGYLRSDLSEDGCHLNQKGSLEWVDFILDKSVKIQREIV